MSCSASKRERPAELKVAGDGDSFASRISVCFLKAESATIQQEKI